MFQNLIEYAGIFIFVLFFVSLIGIALDFPCFIQLPIGVHVVADSLGTIYVTNPLYNRIQIYGKEGRYKGCIRLSKYNIPAKGLFLISIDENDILYIARMNWVYKREENKLKKVYYFGHGETSDLYQLATTFNGNIFNFIIFKNEKINVNPNIKKCSYTQKVVRDGKQLFSFCEWRSVDSSIRTIQHDNEIFIDKYGVKYIIKYQWFFNRYIEIKKKGNVIRKIWGGWWMLPIVYPRYLFILAIILIVISEVLRGIQEDEKKY